MGRRQFNMMAFGVVEKLRVYQSGVSHQSPISQST
jgi:hypothetical protein